MYFKSNGVSLAEATGISGLKGALYECKADL